MGSPRAGKTPKNGPNLTRNRVNITWTSCKDQKRIFNLFLKNGKNQKKINLRLVLENSYKLLFLNLKDLFRFLRWFWSDFKKIILWTKNWGCQNNFRITYRGYYNWVIPVFKYWIIQLAHIWCSYIVRSLVPDIKVIRDESSD